MSDPWLLAPSGTLAEGRVRLEPDEARHLRSALRRSIGDRVVLADGAGCVAQAVVVAAARGLVEVEILSLDRIPRTDDPGLKLAVSVLHTQAMDWMVQKAVEIGVRELVPVYCQRTQLGLSAARRRWPHWQKVAVQALKQCRRPWAMSVVEPVSLADLVEGAPRGDSAVADREGRTISEIDVGRCRLLLVGPEGGFADEELDLLDDAGWVKVRLGEHVLRAETAAVVGAGVILNLQGPRG